MNDWTVQVSVGGDWTEWAGWVDSATAETERQHATEEGWRARIVRAAWAESR